MSTEYAGNPASFPASVNMPSDSDDWRNAATFNHGREDLADRTAFLEATSANFRDGDTVAPTAAVNVGGEGFSFTGTKHKVPSGGVLTVQSGGKISAATGGGEIEIASGGKFIAKSGSTARFEQAPPVGVEGETGIAIAKRIPLVRAHTRLIRNGSPRINPAFVLDGAPGAHVLTQADVGASADVTLWFPIDFLPRGSRVKTIRAGVQGKVTGSRAGHSALPQYRPTLSVYLQSDAGIWTSIVASDEASSVATYDALHEITITLGPYNTGDKPNGYIVFTGEYGDNAVADTTALTGLTVEYDQYYAF